MIRLFVCDDHLLVREGLAQLISHYPELLVAGQASNGEELLNLCGNQTADVILTDLNMPGIHGIPLLNALKQLDHGLKILVLSMSGEGSVVARTLKAGASGFVSKESAFSILHMAIQAVAANEIFIDPSLAHGLMVNQSQFAKPGIECLTDREREVLSFIATGMPLKQVANAMHLSPKTVSTHKINLMKKLDIPNNSILFRFAFEHHTALSTEALETEKI